MTRVLRRNAALLALLALLARPQGHKGADEWRNAGKKSRVEYFSKHFTPSRGCQMRGVLNAAEKKILSPLYVPTSKFLHIGQSRRMGKMGGKCEHVEKMIEDQSLKCQQGMIYHFDIRRETFNALYFLALLLYFLHLGLGLTDVGPRVETNLSSCHPHSRPGSGFPGPRTWILN